MAGTESIVEYINDLHFSENDVAYLRSLNLFDESFLSVLRGLHFTGEIYAMEEGTLVYPYEPLVRVIAPIMEAQLVETALLNLVNHQTLIATKASRVCYAAKGDAVMEFGLRRAQVRMQGTTAHVLPLSAAAAAQAMFSRVSFSTFPSSARMHTAG